MINIGPGVTNCSIQTYNHDGCEIDEDKWLQERIEQALGGSDEVTTVTLVGPPGSKGACVKKSGDGSMLYVQFNRR